MIGDAVQRWADQHGAGAGHAWEMRDVVAEAYACGEETPVVLEIGSHSGASLRVWEETLRPDTLIGIESEDSERVRRGRCPGDGLDALAARGAHIIYGSSRDQDTWVTVKGILAGRSVDFLYIDGDHRYDAVRRDFDVYSALVRPGGLVVLDDATTLGVIDTEVYRLVPEIQRTRRTKLISASTDPLNPDYGTGKLVVYV